MQEGGKRLAEKAAARPKVSVISVVLNAAPLLQELLENLQPYLTTEIELVIIDGGSSDTTVELLKQSEHLVSYWRSEPDDGIYDAMNKATTYASGQWLYFLRC